MKLRSGAIIGGEASEKSIKKSKQSTTSSCGKSRKAVNHEDAAQPTIDSAHKFDVQRADTIWQKAIVQRDYRKVTDTEIDLRTGEYITNIKFFQPELWVGTDERGDTGFFLPEYVYLVHENNEEEAVIRFLELPGEIRNRVYSYVVVFPGKRRLLKSKAPAITRTSRLVRQESLSIFYSRNAWIYRPTGSESGECYDMLQKAIPSFPRPYLRELEIELCYCSNHGSSSLHCTFNPFPGGTVTLKWAGIECTASENRRRRVVRRVSERFQESGLWGDMERTIHFGRIPLLWLFTLIKGQDSQVTPSLMYSCV